MTVTVLLLDADRRDSSLASASSPNAVVMGRPAWLNREGAEHPGTPLVPKGASRDDRFVPLAAVVPTVLVTH
jgi:hypothetical protein